MLAGRTDGDSDWTVYKDRQPVRRVNTSHLPDPALAWEWAAQVQPVAQGHAPSLEDALEEVRRRVLSRSTGPVWVRFRVFKGSQLGLNHAQKANKRPTFLASGPSEGGGLSRSSEFHSQHLKLGIFLAGDPAKKHIENGITL